MASIKALSITSSVGAAGAASSGHDRGRKPFNYFYFAALVGSVVAAGGFVALFFSIGSVVGLNVAIVAWPLGVCMFLMLLKYE
jgi:hypothetical protein